MISILIKNILNFFDYFHKRKITKKLKTLNKKKALYTVFDVGGHRGETVELFLKNFEIENLYSFEPSQENFKILSKKVDQLKKKFVKVNIFIENFALGKFDKDLELNYLNETSSSTIRELNVDSSYFKKKEKFFGTLINKKILIKQLKFKDYLIKKEISHIDLLKIDTEGYELEVLKGLDELISRVSVILFEHHYDNMIKKSYTFKDVHHLLKNNNFYRIFKIKMPFRKSFEYVYIRKNNESLSNNY